MEYPIVIEMAKKRSYAFTLRKTKNPDVVSEADYINFMSKCLSKGMDIKSHVYEDTSGLHVHGVCLLPNHFNFKILRVRGWHLYLREIYDDNGWIDYMNKQNTPNHNLHRDKSTK